MELLQDNPDLLPHVHRLLSRESPSGTMKAVLRKARGTGAGEEKQFLEVWEKNRKLKSFNLSALEKHGPVYEDDCFGCLSWSHSETHLLYVAEKKRPKAESFFQTKALDVSASDDEIARLKKPDQAIKVLVVVANPRRPTGLSVLPSHTVPVRPGSTGF
ncbi:hypothetical protein P7K49_030424 [Saguinus oedipus]|uniref:Acylamino-acid-releasing enzyme N-terminal domain-containing protein n=1 Tax=Saguinus oedipus TaxID=9490 RepID=A0ABQ9U303_SAGOE|nr:hypothetical protein P7K49_030424 [Saguinus oedipus]